VGKAKTAPTKTSGCGARTKPWALH